MEDFQIILFAEKLKKYAKEKYGSINKLALALDMQPSEISNYTKSKPREPRATFLYKLAALGCDLNWLLTGEGYVEIKKDQPIGNNMDLKHVLLINEKTINECKELKILCFDLQMENKKLKEELAEAKDEITQLIKEIERLTKQKGFSTYNS